MQKMRLFLPILLSVALIASGIPAQAGNGCMAAHTQQAAKSVPCKGCSMTGKLESKKGGCCDNGNCMAKCSSLGINASPIHAKVSLPEFAPVSVKFYTADGILPSYLTETQGRPPKNLS